MTEIPLGDEINLGLQLGALALLVTGFFFAFHARRRTGPGETNPGGTIRRHRDVMTLAIALAGTGLVLWMIPAFLSGWYYSTGTTGYGHGGWTSWFYYEGQMLPHWWLLATHLVVGSAAAAMSVYLLLRMRWARFPRRLAIVNFRAMMVMTWLLWIANVAIGLSVFYFYTYLGTG